jgi:hypothetical protein
MVEIEEGSVVAGHEEVVTMLAVDCRQMGQEVEGVRFHPTDLAWEERKGVHADPHTLSPQERPRL